MREATPVVRFDPPPACGGARPARAGSSGTEPGLDPAAMPVDVSQTAGETAAVFRVPAPSRQVGDATVRGGRWDKPTGSSCTRT